MTQQEVKMFRGDFQKAVKQLEKQYGVNISLGTIRYDGEGLRATMKAEKGKKRKLNVRADFTIGDKVKIMHPKADPTQEYEIVKIMHTNIKVKDKFGGLIKVSPSLLKKA